MTLANLDTMECFATVSEAGPTTVPVHVWTPRGARAERHVRHWLRTKESNGQKTLDAGGTMTRDMALSNGHYSNTGKPGTRNETDRADLPTCAPDRENAAIGAHPADRPPRRGARKTECPARNDVAQFGLAPTAICPTRSMAAVMSTVLLLRNSQSLTLLTMGASFLVSFGSCGSLPWVSGVHRLGKSYPHRQQYRPPSQ